MKCITFFIFSVIFIETINASLIPRILGGEDADIQHFPYQASLRVNGRHFCGGAIISQRHILTAAHCISTNIDPRIVPPYVDVTVHTGTSRSDENGNLNYVLRIWTHPEWNTGHPNDVAVIKIAGRISFDSKQQKIDLPNHDIVDGTEGYMTGWGDTATCNSQLAVKLQVLKLTLLSNAQCQKQLPITLHRDEVCAYHSKGHGFCSGDSGGPLVVNNQIAGITSWVLEGYFGSGLPEVFTNVYFHRNFIQSMLNQ